jgi:flagellar export protein FliJ
MKSFGSQIRIHKWAVDEAQRRLADLESLAARLAEDLVALDADMAREQEIARAANEAAATYHLYIAAALRRRETLCRSIQEANAQVDQARDALREAFSALKKFELAAEAMELRARKARDARDLRVQDELGLSIFRRKRI